MAWPFTLNGPLPFQSLLLFQSPLTLPVVLAEGMPRTFDVTFDLCTALLTARRPRGL